MDFATLVNRGPIVFQRNKISRIGFFTQHEMFMLFVGPQNKVIKGDFVRLLRDDSEEVLQALVPHIGTTLEFFAKDGINNVSSEIGRALVKCEVELTKGTNWRLLALFLQQLECLPNCMPPEFIHQHFTPSILNIAVTGVRMTYLMFFQLCIVLIISLDSSIRSVSKMLTHDQ